MSEVNRTVKKKVNLFGVQNANYSLWFKMNTIVSFAQAKLFYEAQI